MRTFVYGCSSMQFYFPFKVNKKNWVKFIIMCFVLCYVGIVFFYRCRVSVNEKKNRREKLQTNNLQQQNKFLFLLLCTCFNIILNFSLILSAIFLSNRFFCCIFIYFDVFVFNAKVMGFWCITFETRLILFMEWNKSLDFVYTFIPCVVMDVINLFDKILH